MSVQLITVDEYKSYIQVTGGTLDPYYTSLINYVSAWIQKYTDQLLMYTTDIFEFFNPRGLEYISVKQRPLMGVTNLWYDPDGLWGQQTGSFDAVKTLQTLGTDYVVKNDTWGDKLLTPAFYSRCGQIVLLTGQNQARWVGRGIRIRRELDSALGTIKVQYNAGYPAQIFPDDLKLAALTLTRALQLTSKNAGWVATSEGTKYYNYALSDVLNKELHARDILAQYKGQGVRFV